MPMELDCNGVPLHLDRPRVMGVLNVTPDSFSDGGRFDRTAAAIDGAAAMVREGAAIIDVGGESTRPGAEPVPLQEELDRVIPVIEALRQRLPVPLSVDTSKPEVIREAVRAGAGMVNDVYALRREGALAAARAAGVPVCLMHMQGEPGTMQAHPAYDDVVAEVRDFLAGRLAACEAAGIGRERLLVDPGFGFGKTLQHNLRLLHDLPQIGALGVPVLVGMSRKRMIGEVLDAPLEGRLQGSVAVATLAAWLGAAVVRVHDVAATVQALAMVTAVKQAGDPARS